MASSATQADARVSALVDRHVALHGDGSARRTNNDTGAAADEDEDALFAALEEEDDSTFRAARAQQLSDELKKYRPANTAGGAMRAEVGGGDLVTTLGGDDPLLKFTTENTGAVVVHFFHPEFARCQIMDGHLAEIARVHGRYGGDGTAEEVKFGRVNVKDAGFVVEKLGVRVLPCVVGFVDGVVVGRVVGFEGIVWGGREDGRKVTRALEEKLVEWKVLEKSLVREMGAVDEQASESEEERPKSGRRGIRSRKQEVDDGGEDDWD